MNWLKRIFGLTDRVADRVDAAGERIAMAVESMADDWEAVAREHRLRLGTAPTPTIIASLPEESAHKRRNGKNVPSQI